MHATCNQSVLARTDCGMQAVYCSPLLMHSANGTRPHTDRYMIAQIYKRQTVCAPRLLVGEVLHALDDGAPVNKVGVVRVRVCLCVGLGLEVRAFAEIELCLCTRVQYEDLAALQAAGRHEYTPYGHAALGTTAFEEQKGGRYET